MRKRGFGKFKTHKTYERQREVVNKLHNMNDSGDKKVMANDTFI